MAEAPQRVVSSGGSGTYQTFDGTYRTFDGSPLEKVYAQPGTYLTVDGSRRTFDGSTRSLSDVDMYRSSPGVLSRPAASPYLASQPSYAAQALEAYSASARSPQPGVPVRPASTLASVDPSYDSIRSMVAGIQASSTIPPAISYQSLPAAPPQPASNSYVHPYERTVV